MRMLKNINLKYGIDGALIFYLCSNRYVIASGCILILIGMLTLINNSFIIVYDSTVAAILFFVIFLVIILIPVISFLPYLLLKNVLKSRKLVFSIRKVDADFFRESGIIKKNRGVSVFNFLSNSYLRIFVQKERLFFSKNYDDRNGTIIFINNLNQYFGKIIIKPVIGSKRSAVASLLTQKSVCVDNDKLTLVNGLDNESLKDYLIYALSENDIQTFSKSKVIEFINQFCVLMHDIFIESGKVRKGSFCPIEISLYGNKMLLFIRNLRFVNVILNCDKDNNKRIIDNMMKLINPLILKT